jgi:hypothetical protein
MKNKSYGKKRGVLKKEGLVCLLAKVIYRQKSPIGMSSAAASAKLKEAKAELAKGEKLCVSKIWISLWLWLARAFRHEFECCAVLYQHDRAHAFLQDHNILVSLVS